MTNNFSKNAAIDWNIYPKNLPKSLINGLIIACLLLGLSAIHSGQGIEAGENIFQNWVLMLLWIPTGVAVCAVPFKLRDESFELKLAYYLGMFAAFIFVLNRLRYWHF